MCKLDNLFRAVSERNLKLVTEILSTQNIIHQDWKDYKLLLLALKQKQKEIAKILLNHGCRVQDVSKKDFIDTPIYYAIEMQDSEMIHLILNKSFSFNSIDHKFQSPFESIIKLNDREVVTKILTAYVNEKINPTDNEGFCPFLIACYVGDTNIVKYFLNIDPSIINRCVKDSEKKFPGFSPLHFATQSGDSKTVEILLSRGADITLKDKSRKSAFMLACVNKNEQIRDLLMKFLFERSAHCVQDEGFLVVLKSTMYEHMMKLNRKYEESNDAWDSWTPLHYAVTLRKPELVELLLKKKANVDAKNNNGLTPLHLACQCSFEEISKTISTNNEGFSFGMDTCDSTIKHNIKKLFILQHKDPFFNKCKFIDTECQCLFPEFYYFELNYIVNPDIKKAMIEERKEIIRILLRHGAEVNVTDNIGATPLHDLLARDYFFGESDKIEIIEEILNKGADVNAKTKANVVPLYLALRYSFLEVARILIDHNVDIKRPMETCTHYISKIYFDDCENQRFQFSPIHVLLYWNTWNFDKSFSILKLLLENGADPNVRDPSDLSLLDLAIFLYHKDMEEKKEIDRIFMTLLKFGAEVDSRNCKLRTPLCLACMHNYDRAVSILLDYGADINAVDVDNKISLHFVFNNFVWNKNVFRTMKQHLIKLKYIGLYVSQENKKYLELGETFFLIPEIGNFPEQCIEEIDRLKKTKINNYMTLYDAFKEEPNDLAAHVNDTFKEIVESNNFGNTFKLYGCLLKLKYKKSSKRKLLVDEAEKALQFFTQWEIPNLCIRIIANLSNENLQVLTEAYATTVNDAHQ